MDKENINLLKEYSENLNIMSDSIKKNASNAYEMCTGYIGDEELLNTLGVVKALNSFKQYVTMSSGEYDLVKENGSLVCQRTKNGVFTAPFGGHFNPNTLDRSIIEILKKDLKEDNEYGSNTILNLCLQEQINKDSNLNTVLDIITNPPVMYGTTSNVTSIMNFRVCGNNTHTYLNKVLNKKGLNMLNPNLME